MFPPVPTLQAPLPERTYIYEYDSTTRMLGFSAQGSDFTVDLPANPMLGTVGVAPARREVRSSLVPESFGGNMDTPEMAAGATCYLRVNVHGALFSLGDGHYRQGEGESCGTAVEGAMNVTAIVDLVKGGGPAWPRLETDTHLMCIGSGRPLEEAWRASQVDMIGWMGELYGLDRLDAYQLLTQISQVPIANVVDTNYSVVTKIDKRLLPSAAAYGGIHGEIRSAARLWERSPTDENGGKHGSGTVGKAFSRDRRHAWHRPGRRRRTAGRKAAVAYCARTADAVADTQSALAPTAPPRSAPPWTWETLRP